jgi:uncharacterized protein
VNAAPILRRLGIAILIGLAANAWIAAQPPPRPAFACDSVLVQLRNGQAHALRVELARTAAEHAYGLMFVKQLDADAGMLFLNRQDRPQRFWMKNTLIPLDILFIAADGRIVNIAPCTEPLSLNVIASEGPARAVLEIRGGRAAELGIQPGDKVIYRELRP